MGYSDGHDGILLLLFRENHFLVGQMLRRGIPRREDR